MLVSASTECFANLSFQEAIEKLVDLEYTNVEVAIHENGNHITPTQVAEDLDAAVMVCCSTHRMNVVSYSLDIQAEGDEYYKQFAACCRLAKATKVVTLTVPSGEHGTPFNEEVERLRKLVDIATLQGVRVAMRTQVGCISDDPDTVILLCNNVKGLGITLDPSHFIYGCDPPKNYEKLLELTYHVHLRDTNKKALQVRIGQGDIEYGKLVSQLAKVGYNRALSVHMTEIPNVDHFAEMRKMRLLLESLL